MASAMSPDHVYPLPRVFLVDSGGGQVQDQQPPNLVPCWTFPPARERAGGARARSRGCGGVGLGPAMVVLLMFLLVFAALGLGAYEIYKIRAQLREVQQSQPEVAAAAATAHKLVGQGPGEDTHTQTHTPVRSAAHVIGRAQNTSSSIALRWEAHSGRAFAKGGVAYRPDDGSLQVSEAGLYHVYSRVELLLSSSHCTTFQHTVLVWRAQHHAPDTLTSGRGEGQCAEAQRHARYASSYLGLVVQLQRGDRVLVSVTQAEHLSHTHHASFFGLHRV